MTVIELDDVVKRFPLQTGLESLLSLNREYVKAINGVSVEVDQGKILGLVGESGCGKTTLAKLIMRLHEPTSGTIRLHSTPIEEYGVSDYYSEVQMIFQDPFKSLNPRLTVRSQLGEILAVHGIDERDDRIIHCLRDANLTPPEKFLDSYPHELSGGERQRVAIARALLLDPTVIVADEPVSMLDVSIRANILQLFQDIVEEKDISMVYISHDLTTVRHICDDMAVMYLGKVMEHGDAGEIIDDPRHPYTQELIRATPVPDPSIDRDKVVTDGNPDAVNLPDGCFYKRRCPHAVDACDAEDMALRPPPASESGERGVACHRVIEGEIE